MVYIIAFQNVADVNDILSCNPHPLYWRSPL